MSLFGSDCSKLKNHIQANSRQLDNLQIEVDDLKMDLGVYRTLGFGEPELEERLYDIESQLRNFDEWAQQINRKFICEPKPEEVNSMKEEKKELLDRYFQYLQILQDGNKEPSTSNTSNIKDIKEKIENILEDEKNRLRYKEDK